jgi:hypothetical protein
MNNGTVSTYPIAPSGVAGARHKVQSDTSTGAAQKSALFAGLTTAPTGKCVIRFFLSVAAYSATFHLEGSAGAADAALANGQRIDSYYGAGYVDVVVDPRTQTHVDWLGSVGGAAFSLCWQILSAENQSHPGG